MSAKRSVLLVDDVELFLELEQTFSHRKELDLLMAIDPKEIKQLIIKRKPEQMKQISESLQQVYEANQSDERFMAKVGCKNIDVTPLEQFHKRVSDVIQRATH